MRHLNTTSRTATLLALICVASCRPNLPQLPTTPPNYRGQISGKDFQSGTSGLGELTMLRLVPAPGTNEIPSGFARIDGSTKFIFRKQARIDSTQIGLPGLNWAHVRVWYHVAPTSRTPSEIWGNAQLVVVDSAGKRPLTSVRGPANSH